MHRWVAGQSIALLHWFRRLRIRWEIRNGIREAFLSLARGIICWRRLAGMPPVSKVPGRQTGPLAGYGAVRAGGE